MHRRDTAKFVKQSRISFKRLGRGRVRFTARILYRASRLELTGVFDTFNRRAEPFRQSVVIGGRRVYDMDVVSGTTEARAQIRFGAATTGVRRLALHVDHGNEIITVGGNADGSALVTVPVVACGCSDAATRPQAMLAWTDASTARVVRIQLKGGFDAEELAGLVGVLDEVRTARQGGEGPGDDFIDCIKFVFCLIGCAFTQLDCAARNLGRPGREILDPLCDLVVSACISGCRLVRRLGL